MIWQLLRRDKVFILGAPALAALLVLFIVAPMRFMGIPADGLDELADMQAALFVFVALQMTFLASMSQPKRKLFEATLPICVRDLWLSDTLALLSIIWLPALAMAAFGTRGLIVLEAAAALTVAVLALNLRIPPLGVQPRLPMLLLLAVICCALAVFRKVPQEIPWPTWLTLPSPAIVFSACGLASIALLVFGTLTAPKSLQFRAAARPEAQPDQPTAEPQQELGWLPLLRSTWEAPQILLTIPLIAMVGPLGLFLAVANPFFFPSIIDKARWLLALPISQRRMFAWIALPPGLALAAGCLGNFYLSRMGNCCPRTPWAELSDLGVALTGVHLALFGCLLAYSRWFSRLPVWLRWIPYVSVFVAWSFAAGFWGEWPGKSIAVPLPGLAVLVAVSYWLAQSAFAAREYRPLYMETSNISVASS